jgi:hypothetical protein
MQPEKLQLLKGTGDEHRLCVAFAPSAVFAAICLTLAFSLPAQGETVLGSPLDTIMSTHFHADVPEASDFVRESRPPPEVLDYAPLTGPDREGPKLKTGDELKALEKELEKAAAQNEQLARKRLGLKKPAPGKPAKGEEGQADNSAKR